jgi:hypothetical protein
MLVKSLDDSCFGDAKTDTGVFPEVLSAGGKEERRRNIRE